MKKVDEVKTSVSSFWDPMVRYTRQTEFNYVTRMYHYDMDDAGFESVLGRDFLSSP